MIVPPLLVVNCGEVDMNEVSAIKASFLAYVYSTRVPENVGGTAASSSCMLAWRSARVTTARSLTAEEAKPCSVVNPSSLPSQIPSTFLFTSNARPNASPFAFAAVAKSVRTV